MPGVRQGQAGKLATPQAGNPPSLALVSPAPGSPVTPLWCRFWLGKRPPHLYNVTTWKDTGRMGDEEVLLEADLVWQSEQVGWEALAMFG